MAVKASATITLTSYRDTQSVTRYYKLQPAGSSAPLKPETKPPSSDWTDSEPACDISKELYFCDLTIFSNGEWEYSKVSKSTSYEAAKEAYNRAQNAQTTAEESAKTATDFISPTTNNTEDDGLKICPRAEINDPKNYLNINTDSISIYKNGNEIAKYSQGILIKDDNGNKVFSAEIMNGKMVTEHLSSLICKKISAGVTTDFSFDLTVAPIGDIEGIIPVSTSSDGWLLGIFDVYSFMERPEELSIPSEYGTGTVLVNSISCSNKTVTISITNNTNIEIEVGSSGENADHMIWYYYMRNYGVATRCGGFWENDYTKAFAIGVGYNDYDRKNAFAVDWNGNTIMQGRLTVGGHDSPIGTRLATTKNNIKITAGIDKPHDGASLNLGKGTWVVVARWSFGTRASGTTSSNRQTSISVNGTIYMSQRINVHGGNYGTVQCVTVVNLISGINTVICKGACSQATSGTNYDSSLLEAVRIA